MTEPMTGLIRGLSLAALMMAGSCAAPTNDANGLWADGTVNHPILVEPSYQSVKIYYSPADRGLNSAEAARFAAFVDAYRAHGNGSIIVNAPAGGGNALTFFADRMNEMGISRDRIIVATHEAPRGDMRVELNYVAYQARTNLCGDWSDNLANTAANGTPKNFGCAVQHNIAAMVADPRDLLGPRSMDPADSKRRATVVDHYEKGEITQANKRTSDLSVEQSASVSNVGQ